MDVIAGNENIISLYERVQQLKPSMACVTRSNR
jgi:hypothetical protein